MATVEDVKDFFFEPEPFTVGEVNQMVDLPTMMAMISFGERMVDEAEELADNWFMHDLQEDEVGIVRIHIKLFKQNLKPLKEAYKIRMN